MRVYLIFILIFISAILKAQSADDYFHNSTKTYVHGDSRKALDIVNEGLKIYPTDKKLTALKNAIEEKQDKQDQDQNKDEKEQDQEKQDQNKDQQDKQDENKDKQDQKQDQQKQDQDKKDQQKQEQQQQPQPKEISKKDAERMLQALKNGEKETLEKLKKARAAKAQRVKIEKDW